MASITNRPNGHRWIQFLDRDKRRRTVRLGKCSRRDAETICRMVEEILSNQGAGNPLRQHTADWLLSCPDDLHDKLVRVGLAEPRETSEAATMGEFTQGYIDGLKATRKSATIEHLERCRTHLVAFFGHERDLATVTKADALAFREWLLAMGYSTNTVNRRIGRAKQFFQSAIDAELLSRGNPFKGQDTQVRPNEERFHFVERSDVEAILEAIPCPQWRLVVALARYAGLRRCELWTLCWSHINWERRRVLIDSTKTGPRYIPLFVEIVPYLQEYQDSLPDGATDVVLTRFPAAAASNIGTQFQRWCDAASVPRWVKPFQNMRSSCEVDLNNQGYPQHTVCRWLGHSENTAFRFYLRTTDAEFCRAAGLPERAAKAEAVPPENAAKCEAEAACSEMKEDEEDPGNSGAKCTSPQKSRGVQAPPVGLERS